LKIGQYLITLSMHDCYGLTAAMLSTAVRVNVSEKKLCQCYFLNNSVKHWPILLIFGTQHHEENGRKRLLFCPPHLNTVATLPCEMQAS